jgi:hypothetical protein
MICQVLILSIIVVICLILNKLILLLYVRWLIKWRLSFLGLMHIIILIWFIVIFTQIFVEEVITFSIKTGSVGILLDLRYICLLYMLNYNWNIRLILIPPMILDYSVWSEETTRHSRIYLKVIFNSMLNDLLFLRNFATYRCNSAENCVDWSVFRGRLRPLIYGFSNWRFGLSVMKMLRLLWAFIINIIIIISRSSLLSSVRIYSCKQLIDLRRLTKQTSSICCRSILSIIILIDGWFYQSWFWG